MNLGPEEGIRALKENNKVLGIISARTLLAVLLILFIIMIIVFTLLGGWIK